MTGNTVVDSLKLTLNKTSPSKIVYDIMKKADILCSSKSRCKIILLTCHRRENFYKPIYNILNAVLELLRNFNDIIVIFPFHLNPNVQKSIKDIVPQKLYDTLIKGKTIEDKNYIHLKRLLMIPPLDYVDLIHLEAKSDLIMSDSGGIQEEAVSIGKPLLILRENTERPEPVKFGCAFITGTSFNKIYHYASSILLNNDLNKYISKCKQLYGYGNSSIIISEIIQNYFKNNTQKSFDFNYQNYNQILSNYDYSIQNSKDTVFNNGYNIYDIVIVLTVWKRNNLERQLIQVKNQSILKNKRTNLIIFQNSNHVNIGEVINRWNNSNSFNDKVDLTFIQSKIETGYYGRFLIPLTSSVNGDSYFFICDDDIIWGNRYFENMARVVDEGSLATRNGRIINQYFQELIEPFRMGWTTKHICYNEDIEYDFGGHIWAGRISWLRKSWNYIPISIENCEDFWISAVLKSYYNISTKTPKCPCPENNLTFPDMCAASDKSAFKHEMANLGNSTIGHNIRTKLIKEISINYNYKSLNLSKPEYVKNIHKKFIYGNATLFNVSDIIWKDALFWQ